jgi:5'-nucleotidase
MNRRHFIKNMSSGALLLGTGGFPLDALTGKPEIVKLTILHTNDVHSRIDPFPMDGSSNQGLGGAAKRATLIKKIRTQEKNILLLDAGDIFQGTPYFNFYEGELEMKLMSQMGYDAATIGNHDFDKGIDGLKKQLAHAHFPLINANYDFSNTVMKGQVQPHKIFKKDGVKIGVLGVGIELKGLVPQSLSKETVYNDPLSIANKTAEFLKKDMKCDYVICLSHLGYKYKDTKIDDVKMAQNSRHIDLIIGGHTHTFMDKPDILKNLDGQPVLINQVGWAGIMLGRIDVFFERTKGDKCESCQNIYVGA